eukprot:CAMPEP_0184545674 /NCGR_PEP_ID=MMETSP0199_2-20130426/4461_1 /TAXON_ID=1112570 /ORGANISM="Thraustochytrium sp., Strain LLF1b" /LENGTH=646 /DNA_ID=CAMNT_0026939995 /DNA_START=75 /DNA_END=2015 /DNA_ORIENTATION=+
MNRQHYGHPMVQARLRALKQRKVGMIPWLLQRSVPVLFVLAVGLMLFELSELASVFEHDVPKESTVVNLRLAKEEGSDLHLKKEGIQHSAKMMRFEPNARDQANSDSSKSQDALREDENRFSQEQHKSREIAHDDLHFDLDIESDDETDKELAESIELELDAEIRHNEADRPSDQDVQLELIEDDSETTSEAESSANEVSNQWNQPSEQVEVSEVDLDVKEEPVNELEELAKSYMPPKGHTSGYKPPSGTLEGDEVILQPSITLPHRPIVKSFNVDKNYWPWYKILHKKHGWAHVTDVPDIQASMLLSRGAVPKLRKGKMMLNSIGPSGCLGGSKLLQFECRQRLATKYGCNYEDLAIQPVQFSMDTRAGCEAWYQYATRPGHEEYMWLYKPSNTFHGSGIKIFKGPEALYQKLQQCKKLHSAIVMYYISNPGLMGGGYKFDMRTYLLVGSLDPQLVFYADGFVRKSDTKYDENDSRATVHITNSVKQKRANHFFSFEDMARDLQNDMGFSPGYLDRARDYMKKVSTFIFKTTETNKKPLSRFPGRFHLFAIDWVIDSSGQIHLLEGNGYPLVTQYPLPDLTPQIWEDLIDLVMDIHVHPENLDPKLTVKREFKRGKWSLIYNELEDLASQNPFNPCAQFPAQPHK